MRRSTLFTASLVSALLFNFPSIAQSFNATKNEMVQWPFRGMFMVIDAYDAKNYFGILLRGTFGREPVYPIADGHVHALFTSCAPGDTACNTGLGNVVIIKHPRLGVYSLYAHLADISRLKLLQPVSTEHTIGIEGTTGTSEDPCTGDEISYSRLQLSIWEDVVILIDPIDGDTADFRFLGSIDPKTILPTTDDWGEDVNYLTCLDN